MNGNLGFGQVNGKNMIGDLGLGWGRNGGGENLLTSAQYGCNFFRAEAHDYPQR